MTGKPNDTDLHKLAQINPAPRPSSLLFQTMTQPCRNAKHEAQVKDILHLLWLFLVLCQKQVSQMSVLRLHYYIVSEMGFVLLQVFFFFAFFFTCVLVPHIFANNYFSNDVLIHSIYNEKRQRSSHCLWCWRYTLVVLIHKISYLMVWTSFSLICYYQLPANSKWNCIYSKLAGVCRQMKGTLIFLYNPRDFGVSGKSDYCLAEY